MRVPNCVEFTEYRRTLEKAIVTDASPWGIGGYMMLGDNVLAYFASTIDQQDEHILDVQIGSPSSQQVLEALAALVALKIWRKYWRQCGVHLIFKSDSVSTLTLLIKLRPKMASQGLGIIARELALEFGCCSYKPRYYHHIPGVANDWADHLSRLSQPDKHYQIPAVFAHCRREQCPHRSVGFCRSISTAKQGSSTGSNEPQT